MGEKHGKNTEEIPVIESNGLVIGDTTSGQVLRTGSDEGYAEKSYQPEAVSILSRRFLDTDC